jgi:hypothetical protein
MLRAPGEQGLPCGIRVELLPFGPRFKHRRAQCGCDPAAIMGSMRRLTQAPNIAIAALWVEALRQAGIEASVQRYFLGAAAGELPPDQCLPEIWVTDDRQERAARSLLDDLSHVPQRRWTCRCGELVEGGFEQCWSCGRLMP